jgi:hypothetical protein
VNLPAPAVPLDVRVAGVRAVPVNGGVWRVVAVRGGEMLGHVEALDGDTGRRYRAKRFDVRERRFRALGDFWTPADAVDAVRFG